MVESNKEFELAFEFVNGTDRNIFLTGKAGTGKTTFLKELKAHSHKKMIVLAPTGVAAINAGGKTIHSIFAIPREPILSTKLALLENLRFTSQNRDLLNSLDTIVFDEASMIRSDVLDAVDYLLRKIRQNNHPFGGIQVLFIGDMYQLSPIAKSQDLVSLGTEYNTPFLIDSKVFRELNIVFIELKKVYRQTDDGFLELLENIRTASCTPEQLKQINKMYREDTTNGNGWITLTTHTKFAEIINEESLYKLPGNEIVSSATISGDFEENLYPVLKDLKIKIGAQVMLVRNDSAENQRYFNGKIGKLVEIFTNKIVIEFSGNDQIELKKEIWVNSKYQFDNILDRISTETLGTFEQFPIKLAWAITIHKSQGLTFDCAIIDAGASFTPGQVYVAFSRLRSLHNVWLRSKITNGSISLHPVVKRFEHMRSAQPDIVQTLRLSEKDFYRRILTETFDWHFLEDCVKSTPPLPATIFSQYKKNLVDDLRDASSFQKVLLRINIDGVIELNKVRERVTSARLHFQGRHKEVLTGFKNYVKANKNDIHHKRNIPLAQNFIKTLNKISALLVKTEQLAKLMTQGISLGPALKSLRNSNSLVPKPLDVEGNTSNEKVSLEYFRQGKSIDEIATIRNLNSQTIEYHLSSFISSGEVNILELISPVVLENVLPAALILDDLSLMNLKKQFGSSLTLGQISALREHLSKK